MSDAVTIIGELEELTKKLDKASRLIYTLQEELAPLEEQMDDLTNDLLVSLLDEYETSEKRLPGEDVRNAIVTKRIREREPILFGSHRRKTKELDRLERRASSIRNQMFSKQTSLNYEKTIAGAT